MKLFVVAAVLGVCSAGRLDNSYLPPNQGGSGFGGGSGGSGFGGGAGGSGFGGGAGGSGFGGGAGGYSGGFGQTQHSGNAYNNQGGYGGDYQGSTRQQSSFEKNAQILRLNNEVKGDSFSYDFETSNGIRADASGVATHGVQSQGSFGYKGDDGQDYSITYTADENGYRPQGAHLPTPPPIPEAILKSLEQNARDEAAGISDDGSYRGEGAHGGQGGYGSGPAQQYSAPSSQYGAPSSQYSAPSSQYSAPSNQYGAPARNQPRPSSPSSPSRQYLTPNAAPRGSGNFNPQTGYQY